MKFVWYDATLPNQLLMWQKVCLALLDCVSRANAVARASVVRPSVVRPSVKRVFSETVKQINAKICGKVAIHHISRPFFPFLKILDF